jgi:fatty acid desaturase
MFSKSKKESRNEAEQREQYEYARERILQKKGLLSHLIYFIVGAILLAIINLALGVFKEITFIGYHWFVWAIVVWGFLFLTHVFNVLVKNRFMDKEWENHQLEKLKKLQEKRISELDKEAEKEVVLELEAEKKTLDSEEEI